MPWTPHDLPFLTEKAATAYHDLVAFWQEQDISDALQVIAGLEDSARMLESAPLSWLDADMCGLLGDMWQQVPDWTPAACVPGSEGLMAFEEPFFTAPYESATTDNVSPVPVRAVGWRVDGPALRITAWVWNVDVPTAHRSPLRGGLELEEVLAVTIPMEAVVDGAAVFERTGVTPDDEAFDDAAMTLQSVAGSAWLIMSQPRMVSDEDVVMRVRKRGAGGKTVKAPVRVSVRRLVSPPSPRAVPTGRKAATRWWVRGHWRQQPWGKGRALRKPVWIAPHTAGAQDAEIDDRPQVQVWRTGEDNE